MIEIPTHTPLGHKVDTIGLWISGGADSALLCFLLADHIKQTQLPVKIQPLTIDYKKPFQNIGVAVKNKVIELLDAEDVFLEHIVYNLETTNNLAKVFHGKNYDNFKENRFQVLFSGISTNPPKEVQENFRWGVLPDVEAKRGETVEKTTVRYFVQEEEGRKYEFLEIKPFFNINKKEISKMYRERQLIETLFPVTRSCEKPGTVTGHCGECWWCEERLWAFNQL
jgi:7-cyano-7-deazaguanine synthase in queuosine biosynthesis